MKRKQSISEHDLMFLVHGRIRALFPQPDDDWDVWVDFSSDIGADGTLRVKTPGSRWIPIPIDIRWNLQPRMVAELARRAKARTDGPTMVMAPYLSPETQTRLAEARLSYGDLTGNISLICKDPAVFVRGTGASKDPNPEPRSLQSLKGPGAGAVVRALCDFKPPYLITELAKRASLPVATVFRVVELLDQDGLLDRDADGRIVRSDWPGILRRWSRDYQGFRKLPHASFLDPRGLQAFVGKLKAVSEPYSVTGSLAAARLAAVASPALAMVYAHDKSSFVNQLDLKPVERGMNVIVIQAESSTPLDRAMTVDGVQYASPSQVVVDLLGGPGRSPQEGEALLKWMKEHEDEWRR